MTMQFPTPQTELTNSTALPDPWLSPTSSQERWAFSPHSFVPLDPSHALSASLPPVALLSPPDHPDLLKLPAPSNLS